jgi:hypothetical protein
MQPNLTLALAAITAVLSTPLVASAQSYWGQQNGGYQPTERYGAQPRGDWYRSDRPRFAGYPEFRQIEAHIGHEIREGLERDQLDPEDARDLFAQLRQIRMREQQEFRTHGWDLPNDDREHFRDALDRLDHLVDTTRQED